jgi:hypothetical protein
VLLGGVQSPRYLPDMARVMGTTVEVLAAGRYRYKQAPLEDVTRPTADELDHLAVVRRLSGPAREMLANYLVKLRAMDAAGEDDGPAFARPAAPSRKRLATGG